MKTKNHLPIICGILLASCFIVNSCASSKPKLVVSDNIFNYYPIDYVSDNNFSWIYGRNVKITTLKYSYPENGFVLYAQKIDDVSESGRILVLYFYPISSDLDPMLNKLKIVSYVFNYQSGANKKVFITIHWINCRLVCNNKELKNFLNRVF